MSREEILSPYLGKRQEFKGKIIRVTNDKVLLTDINKEIDHMWVSRKQIEKKEDVRTNFMISFTGVPYEYIGLSPDHKQVTKCGVKSISKVTYLYKLRKGQR